MATLLDCVTTLRDRLDEETEGFWREDEVRRYISEGVRDVARRVECVRTQEEISTVGGTQTYDMPTDVVRVYRVEYQDASDQVWPLEHRQFNSMDQIWGSWQRTTTSSRPYIFTMWGYPPNLEVTVYPTPVATGDTIRVFYYSIPDAVVNNDDVIPLPTGWEDLAVQYAEYVALRKDRNPQWQEAKALYEQKIGEMIDRTRDWSDQMGMIDWRSSGLPGWLYNPDGW